MLNAINTFSQLSRHLVLPINVGQNPVLDTTYVGLDSFVHLSIYLPNLVVKFLFGVHTLKQLSGGKQGGIS